MALDAKVAVEWMMSKQDAAGDTEPTLVSDKAQVVAAMKDPRYGKDTAYTQDVEDKLGRSSVF